MTTNTNVLNGTEVLSIEDLVDHINWNVLPRKSFDTNVVPQISGIESDLPPEVLKDYIDSKKQNSLNARKEDPINESAELWDDFWAGELARTEVGLMLAGQGASYLDYLPGRYLMYRQLVEAIESNLQGRNQSVEDMAAYEIGGGSGLGLSALAQSGATVTNFDFSEVALQYFEYLATSHGVIQRTNTMRGDFYSTGIPDDESDITYNVGVFEHLKDHQQHDLMREMVRITKPGGLILISVPNLDGPHYPEMRKRQGRFHRITSTRGPMEHLERVNVPSLMREYGIETEEPEGVLLAPSHPIDKGLIKSLDEEDRKLYSSLLKVVDETREKINAWWQLEDRATPEQKLRLSWFHYTIGIKH